MHNRKRSFTALCLILCCSLTQAQQATWIWYPGDFDVWLGNKMQNRRTERNAFLPPFWKLDSHYPLVDFHKDIDLSAPEDIQIAVEGTYNIKLDGKAFPGTPSTLSLPAGRHRLSLKVFNQASVPAVFIKGATVVSDSSWLLTFEDKEWIDASGKASDQSGTSWLQAGYWNFNDPASPPSSFRLPVSPQQAVKTTRNDNAMLVDFGKETFGFVKLEGLKGKGKVSLYYGESPEEAQSTDSCETYDQFLVDQSEKKDWVMAGSRAFRYVYLRLDPGVGVDAVSMLYEYAALADKGSFRCSDEQINRIYDVAKYTLHLNSREFFIDGIKRDRWVWSGDAYQSYLMNYYLFFDSPTVERTLAALRGKDPVTSHINTIMDYTFYWFLGIYDYYRYTGKKDFIRQFYPRMKSIMDFVLARRNSNGLLEGLPGDWIFIDWADGLSKQGEVSFEQLLLARSLEAMSICAGIAADAPGAATYRGLADDLKTKLFQIYWNSSKGALMHSRVNGTPTTYATRYANMFAIFFDYLSEAQRQAVKQHVLLNDSVQKITTPYMRFYELEALCALGEQAYVLKEMKDYWGGMLNLGATSFWEEYNPAKKGVEHLAMYGRPYGKSLCHAWGASPIYLLGKYYLGVKPTAPGYASYLIEPKLGGLQWMQGEVPTPNGAISVYCSTKQIRISAAEGSGTLRFASKSAPSAGGVALRATGSGRYEMEIEKGKSYTVSYTAATGK